MLKKLALSIVLLSMLAYASSPRIVADVSFLELTATLPTTTIYTVPSDVTSATYRVSTTLECSPSTASYCASAQFYLGWTNGFQSQQQFVPSSGSATYPAVTVRAVGGSPITAFISFGSNTPEANAYFTVEKLPVP